MNAHWRISALGALLVFGCLPNVVASKPKEQAVPVPEAAVPQPGEPLDVQAASGSAAESASAPAPDAGSPGADAGVTPDAAPAPISTLVPLASLVTASERGFMIQGAERGDNLGSSVAIAGDVNGDGLDDLIVGAPRLELGTGKAYVVFGSREPATITASTLAGHGFAIESTLAAGQLGWSVSGAGDLNGDGLDDLLVSAGAEELGVFHVVFGKTDTAPVDVHGPGTLHFSTFGPDRPLMSLAPAGDVNGDGLDDLVAAVTGEPSSALVIFGNADPQSMALSDANASGFRIETGLADNSVSAVSAAGDLNGDGLDDIVVVTWSGPYAVFGKRDSSPVTLTTLGDSDGFLLISDWSGDSATAAGDMNGDGVEDVAVSSASGSSLSYAGMSQVLFGPGNPPRDLHGFVIEGADDYDADYDWPVAGAGDVDGDGLDDLVLGASRGTLGVDAPEEGPCLVRSCDTGMVYVVFGDETEATRVSLLDFESSAPGGFAVVGLGAASWTGTSVAGGGDLNGDGLDDLIIGAPGSTFYEESERASLDVGRAFVLYGAERAGASRAGGPRLTLRGGSGADVLEHPGLERGSIDGGNGTDTLRITTAGSLSLEQGLRRVAAAQPGPGVSPPPRGPRVHSIEIIDLTPSAPTTLVLDDAAVRRLPQSRPGLPFGLAKMLTVLGGAEDHLTLDLSPYTLVGMDQGRRVYQRPGTFYGLALSADIVVSP